VLGLLLSCKEKKNDVWNTYQDEKENILDSIQHTEKGLFETSDHFKSVIASFSEEQKTEILLKELEVVLNFGYSGIGASGKATIFTDGGIKKTKCGTYDKRDSTVVKAYPKQRLDFVKLANITYNIPVRWVVIDEEATDRQVSDSLIAAQLKVLNDAFEQGNISFFTEKIERSTNTDWYTALRETDHFYEMMEHFMREPITAIAIYVTNQNEVLGSALFPWDTHAGTVYDGILLDQDTFPGKIIDGEIMLGKTLIHEMGHYLGLFHTFHSESKDANGKPADYSCDSLFNNGCDLQGDEKYVSGDFISMTPPQKICHFSGCGDCLDGDSISANDINILHTDEQQRIAPCDTCPAPGTDPVTNYMGYNPDSCMNHFVSEQIDIMQINLLNERSYLLRGNLLGI
jgi:predicted Zn-dependent protease|tara:strand:+ start:441 stop:1643 length:1203 start_codon:yes stop_codon:yes gene_type:complete